MSEKILIDPVTRIAGHGKISIYLNNAGVVEDAKFHVTEYRGFEKFCQGLPLAKMMGIIGHLCGICPISHTISTCKAIEKIQGVTIPSAAKKLRRLLSLAEIIQSHCLCFFYLSSPDLLLGWDCQPKERNLFGLMAANRDFAIGGIRLRQFAQEIVQLLGGRKINPPGIVPGGMKFPLKEEDCSAIRDRLDESLTTVKNSLAIFKRLLDNYSTEVDTFGNFPSLFMGLVGSDGTWENYEGKIQVIDSEGKIVADNLNEDNYQDFIGETVEKGTYVKFPYYKPWGYPEGNYRVGPLARLNLCSCIGTPQADRELREYRDRTGRVVNSSFYYHYARLLELLASVEKIAQLLDDPEILSQQIRTKVAQTQIEQLEGVGVGEAPRGILFHHYQVDEQSSIENLNLVIATGQNIPSMNQTITQIAKHYIHGTEIAATILNRVEAGVRIFDPCLGCSTHAVGQMPLHIQLVGSDGQILNEIWRN